jgi:hypothetical protein
MFSASGLEWLHRWNGRSIQEESTMFGHRTIRSTFRTAALGALALTALAAGEAQAGGPERPVRPGYVLVDNGQPYGADVPDTAAARTADMVDTDVDTDADGAEDATDLQPAQWGPPHGNAWGHPRHRGWGAPPRHWGPERHWRQPRHWGPRCRTVWERRYDPWRGWSSYPVRRCW